MRDLLGHSEIWTYALGQTRNLHVFPILFCSSEKNTWHLNYENSLLNLLNLMV